MKLTKQASIWILFAFLVAAMLSVGGAHFIKAAGTPAFYSVKDYGAVGNGVADDTIAIRNTIAAAANGGVVFFPEGTYSVQRQSTETALLTVDKPIHIMGTGYKSVISVKSTVPSTVDVIKLSPGAGNGWMYKIRDLAIKPASGTPARHAILLDTPVSGQFLSKLMIEHNVLGAFGGYGIASNNPVPYDGLFTSAIENNRIENGILLDNAGSNINITGNFITGKNVGVTLNMIPGAVNVSISKNQIESKRGGVKITAGSEVKITNNVIVQNQTNDATAGERNLIHLSAPTGTISHTVISGNKLNGDPALNGNTLENAIYLNAASSTKIYHNVITKGVNEAIKITSTTSGTDIGYNNTINATGVNAVTDSGTGTIGSVKAATLENSWVDYDTVNYEAASFIKDGEGTVFLQGLIKNGTTTSGTRLFVLPDGFKPKFNKKFAVTTYDGTAYTNGEVEVKSNGDVVLLRASSNYLSLDGVSFSTIE
jgi:hypothetical protein